MAVDRGCAAADDLGVGQRGERFGVELGHGSRDGGGCVGPAQHEWGAEHRLVGAAEGAHGTEHGFVPDQRRVAVAIAGDHWVGVDEISAKEDAAHLDHVLGVFRAGGHAHEGLVGMLHRRIGDAQMPLADRVIVGFHDVVRAGVQRGQHMGEFVKHRQIIERGVAAHVIEIAQVGRAGHWDEDGVGAPEGDVLFGIAGVVGEGGRDACDEIAHEAPVKVDMFAHHFGTGGFPICQGDVIAEDDADVFEDVHGGRVDALHLAAGQDLAGGDFVVHAGEHGEIHGGAQGAAGGAATTAAANRCFDGHGPLPW